MNPFLIIIPAAILGLIPAYIASRKGRSFVTWWIYGALAFVVALPHSLILGKGGTKTCAFCRRNVPIDAAHCKRCGYVFLDHWQG